MRILGFSRIDWQNFDTHGPKMVALKFSTWRWARRDTDWYMGELVQVVLKPRSNERVVLGTAGLSSVQPRELYSITDEEARADGFGQSWELRSYLSTERYRRKLKYGHTLNKIVVEWLTWNTPMIAYSRSPYEARRYGIHIT